MTGGVFLRDSSDAGVGALIGSSTWTTNLRREIPRIARYDSNVLITGPNGTGKELIARAIHSHSSRSDKQFIPVDCAAFVGSLFPSHMFGHVKGAFTGANYSALGCFRVADQGTLFLDEIGDLEPDLQAKLLRVLQERVVVPVGAVEGVPVDVRIIAATNRDLKQDVNQGRFREDLYYRLNVVLLETAPLVSRVEDIPSLAEHFLQSLADEHGLPHKRLSTEAIATLGAYHWPGNVRQLRNVLERAVVHSPDDVVDQHCLADLLAKERQRQVDQPFAPAESWEPAHHAPLPEDSTLVEMPDEVIAEAELEHAEDGEAWLSLEELERFHIERTLEYTYFNQTAAARLLQITPRVLAGKIKKYAIDVSASRRGRPPKRRRSPR